MPHEQVADRLVLPRGGSGSEKDVKTAQSGSRASPVPPSVASGMMRDMGDVVDLQSRRVCSLRQIDDILGLHAGTSSRWIDGYSRGGKFYEPVIREEHT